MSTIFSGLKVLDLSTVLAGPSVATFFAELGATVTKIENPRTSGDVTRSWKLPGESADSNISAYFSAVNYRKTYLFLDIGDEANRQQLEQLISESDVVIVNFKHGDDQRFRLTPEDLRPLNNDLIYARLTGFTGQPERVAYDVVLQAETGYMFMNGTPQSGPVKMPVAMMDVLAAHQLKEGILCALIKRLQTGKGSIVNCSLEKAGLSALANQASNYLMAGHIPVRLGSRHPNIAPYGETFVCADGKEIVLAVGSDKQFLTLCQLLGAPELSSEEVYIDNTRRVENRKRLAETLSPHFAKQHSEELLQKLIEKNVPAGIIRPMDAVMQNPVAQSMILEENISGITTRRMQSAAFTIEEF
jgi:crotonobetainyl-CoA:carnitine CoA-transferase CaiB-like acyl-CoA transferase